MPMNRHRFDVLLRSLRSRPSRRELVAGLGSGAFSLRLAQLPQSANAKRKRKKRNKKKIRYNDFGCVNVGRSCKNGDQCCSGICEGKRDKKRCQAHDQSTCQAGLTSLVCGGESNLSCTTSGGDPGLCLNTTGNAGYCFASGDCFSCKKDADCEPVCGPGAACIVCAETCAGRGGTFCAGAVADSCDFDL
jgi:hypothetical protein